MAFFSIRVTVIKNTCFTRVINILLDMIIKQGLMGIMDHIIFILKQFYPPSLPANIRLTDEREFQACCPDAFYDFCGIG